MCTYILSNMTNLFLNNSLAKAMIFVAPTISAPVRGQFFDRTVSSPFPCRYLTMSQEELLRTTTLLTEEEMDALMTCLHQEQQSSGGGLGSVISQLATGFLPDHLLEMQSVMRTRRKAREKEEHGIKKLSAAAKKFKDGSKVVLSQIPKLGIENHDYLEGIDVQFKPIIGYTFIPGKIYPISDQTL